MMKTEIDRDKVGRQFFQNKTKFRPMSFLIFLIFLLSIIFLLRLFENQFIYFPVKYPGGYWQPETFGVQVEDCYFNAADGVRLHGWLATHEKPIATLLWCTGNAGNISHRLDNLARLVKLPINVFIFGYRGYGRSEGSPNENGVYLDALAAYDYLASRPDIDRNKIVLFGRSLGGSVAVDLATKRPCAGLILESTFTSAQDMAKSSFGFIPVHLFIKTKFDSINKINRLHVPLLLIHGSQDRTVSIRLGKKLFAAANEPKEFYEIAGADHNDTYIVGGQAYFNRLLDFLRKVSAGSAQ
jgi:hypothetical protein